MLIPFLSVFEVTELLIFLVLLAVAHKNLCAADQLSMHSC